MTKTVNMNVHSPFRLLGSNGERYEFKAGIVPIPEQYQDHWYVLQHATPLPVDAPVVVGEVDNDGEPKKGEDDVDNIAKREADARQAQYETAPVDVDSEPGEQPGPDEAQDAANEEAQEAAAEVTEATVVEETTDPNADLADMSRHQLVTTATKLGITVDGRWNMDRVREEIVSARAKK